MITNECTPYGEYLLAELATRMAAYTVSAAPIERQEWLADLVANSIPKALAEKLQRNMAIKTEWTTDSGALSPNVPEPGKTN